MPDYLVKINDTELTHIKKFKVNRSKLWSDADRNLAGELKSTFIGVFPKISLEFTPMPKADMASLITLLENPSFTVLYYDELSGGYQTGTFYAGDYEMSIYREDTMLYEGMSVNLIPFNKYTPSV